MTSADRVYRDQKTRESLMGIGVFWGVFCPRVLLIVGYLVYILWGFRVPNLSYSVRYPGTKLVVSVISWGVQVPNLVVSVIYSVGT